MKLSADELSKIEPVSEELKAQEEDGKCLMIRNLRKVFTTTAEDRVAVECLNLKVGHAVEVLALTPLEQFPTLDVLVDPFLKPFPRVQHSFPRNILQG